MRIQTYVKYLQILALSTLAVMPGASADSTILSEGEFRSIANELAPKVNLFRDVWKVDPKAEFYGGTTRDFLYWVLRQFVDSHSEIEKKATLKRLRALQWIDVSEFIYSESDVDIISENAMPFRPENYRVRKIDAISPEILNPATPLGMNERNQGYIPAEKIRLGAKGVINSKDLGNGVREILSGKLTVHFANPEIFAKTLYAVNRENHPVLLALRYLRLLAVDYYHEHGTRYPVEVKIPPEMEPVLRSLFEEVRRPQTLLPYFQSPRFTTWFNASIDKAFRSYSNPTAAMALMRHYKIDSLVGIYPEIKSLFNYLFAVRYNPDEVAKKFAEFNTSPERLFTPLSSLLPDRTLLHGTATETAFRAILFQGLIASEKGTAGAGGYGAPMRNINLPLGYAKGDQGRIVKWELKSNTRLIDLTQGEGKRIYELLGADAEKVAAYFGADLLRYPYDSEAYVLKNSEAIESITGLTRELRPSSWFYKHAATVADSTAFLHFIRNLHLQSFTPEEVIAIVSMVELEPTELRKAIESIQRLENLSERASIIALLFDWGKASPIFNKNPALRLAIDELIDSYFSTFEQMLPRTKLTGDAFSNAWNFFDANITVALKDPQRFRKLLKRIQSEEMGSFLARHLKKQIERGNADLEPIIEDYIDFAFKLKNPWNDGLFINSTTTLSSGNRVKAVQSFLLNKENYTYPGYSRDGGRRMLPNEKVISLIKQEIQWAGLIDSDSVIGTFKRCILFLKKSW